GQRAKRAEFRPQALGRRRWPAAIATTEALERRRRLAGTHAWSRGRSGMSDAPTRPRATVQSVAAAAKAECADRDACAEVATPVRRTRGTWRRTVRTPRLRR